MIVREDLKWLAKKENKLDFSDIWPFRASKFKQAFFKKNIEKQNEYMNVLFLK